MDTYLLKPSGVPTAYVERVRSDRTIPTCMSEPELDACFNVLRANSQTLDSLQSGLGHD